MCSTEELLKAMTAFCKLLTCQTNGEVLMYGNQIVKGIGFENGKMVVGSYILSISSLDNKFTTLLKKEEKEEE